MDGYYDYTENYNFRREFNYRSRFSNEGSTIGEIDLGDNFYAELVKDGEIPGITERVKVYLCHREHKEKVYAFTMMIGSMIAEKDTTMHNTVKIKFATNYAKLKRTYSRKYCNA